MVGYQESQKILTELAQAVRHENEIEFVPLVESIGRILGTDLIAREASPSFDNSAMDGFAINLTGFQAPMPGQRLTLIVGGSVAAGDLINPEFNGHQAVEIMTGAPMPSAEYSAVVKLEDVDISIEKLSGKKQITLKHLPKLGENIRRAGEDIKIGQKLLSRGVEIERQHFFTLATLGIAKLAVVKKIKISILSTGRELVDYRSPLLAPGQIRNSSGIYLESYLTDHKHEVLNRGIVGDNIEIYQETIKEAFREGCQVFVSAGAVSVGRYDFVRSALDGLGAQIHFQKCSIRPGKPILFASLEFDGMKRFVFGLPGNPIATAVGLRFFIIPFLNSMLGAQRQPQSRAHLSHEVDKPEGVTCFFKARLNELSGEVKVFSKSEQSSSMVNPMMKTNVWVVLPEEGNRIKSGTVVDVCDL